MTFRCNATIAGSPSDPGLSPMVCAAQKPVAKVSLGRSVSSTMAAKVGSEVVEDQCVVALEAQLQRAVQSQDYPRASELQTELRAARDAARRCGLERAERTDSLVFQPQLEMPAADPRFAKPACMASNVLTPRGAAPLADRARAAQTRQLLALEAELQCTVQRRDFLGAEALQTQIRSVRAAMDRLVKTSPAMGPEDVAASGPEHSVVGAVEVDPVSETATAQRILALQSQLDLAVRAQDFELAVALQSQIAAARQAGDA